MDSRAELKEHEYTLNEFKKDIENNSLPLFKLKKVTLEHFIAAVSVNYNVTDAMTTAVTHCMTLLEKNYKLLYKTSKEKEYKNYSIATQAAASVNYEALDCIIRNLPADEVNNFVNTSTDSGAYKGFCMVHHVAQSGHLEKLKLLQRTGADITAEIKSSGTKYGGWNIQDVAINELKAVNKLKIAGHEKDNIKKGLGDIIKFYVQFIRYKHENEGTELSESEILADIREKHSDLKADDLDLVNKFVHDACKVKYQEPKALPERSRRTRDLDAKETPAKAKVKSEKAKRSHEDLTEDTELKETPAKKAKEDKESEKEKQKEKDKSKSKDKQTPTSSYSSLRSALHSKSSPSPSKTEIKEENEDIAELRKKIADLQEKLDLSQSKSEKMEVEFTAKTTALSSALEAATAEQAKLAQNLSSIESRFNLFATKLADSDKRVESLQGAVALAQTNHTELANQFGSHKNSFALFAQKADHAHTRCEAIELRQQLQQRQQQQRSSSPSSMLSLGSFE